MLTGMLLYACTDVKKQEKEQLAGVLNIHDEVMGKTEKAIANKMRLDTLAMKMPEQAPQIKQLTHQLEVADEAMENWMHQFTIEYDGKSHQQIMDYLASQKQKVIKVDTLVSRAVSQSEKYLSIHQK